MIAEDLHALLGPPDFREIADLARRIYPEKAAAQAFWSYLAEVATGIDRLEQYAREPGLSWPDPATDPEAGGEGCSRTGP